MCAAVHFPVELLTDNAFFSSLLHPSQVSPAGGLSIIRCHGGKGQREHLQRFCRDGFLSHRWEILALTRDVQRGACQQ